MKNWSIPPVVGFCTAVWLCAEAAFAADLQNENGKGAEIKVTWSDIARLLEEHPGLAAGEFQIDAARGGVKAAGAAPNPTFETTVGHGRARAGDDSRVEWGLALSIPLGWIAQRSSKVSAAEAGVDVAIAERRALRRDVLLQLQILFWNVVYEQEREASLDELEAQTTALVRTVKKRVELGEVRPVEAVRVEIEQQMVISEVEAARVSLASRRAQLALWLGVSGDKTIVAAADLRGLPTSTIPDTALADHPAVMAARARIHSLEADVKTERMARVPAVSLTGFTSSELDRRAFGAGLAVDLPIWNWNKGRIAAADAALAASRKQAEATALDLKSSVIEARAACRASVRTATRFGVEVVPRAETAASTMEKTYQLGEVSLLEMIDARRTLLDAHRRYLSALLQAQIDCSRLGAWVEKESK
jgi:cobalt-zinc-cadmium efflux system outer membrane protein